ncbi:hypothetical protein GGI25_000959 [Coemansia spiralis]|uniref:RRM domain-containing protein n=2 Tax=Coemansia TaxID=4863 RepID=A0A9W8GAS5_9FUNG|nr:hypothetical protein BX070DRAFT_87935 [Coemansia spiralis]KAJ1993816.1 hypothetical protein EDC05_001977 [Coemansia umbellata]KAJ2623193.1 hypothetical protein GGI26_002608 [Coemansia sp. RSA 1358]KAJ2680070.1 hypothetical protein GGI25_000959 [Coemansia spiralis]
MFRNVLISTRSTTLLASRQQLRSLACSALYISGLPVDITRERLASYMEKYGKIYEIQIKKPKPEHSTTVATVSFYVGEMPESPEEISNCPIMPEEKEKIFQQTMHTVNELNRKQIDGSTIRINHIKDDMPHYIQYITSMRLRSAKDPVFAAIMEVKRRLAKGIKEAGIPNDYGIGYTHGYEAGVAEGRRIAEASNIGH